MNPETIDTLLPEAHISLSGAPTEKRACIEYLLDLAVAGGRVSDREAALAALLEREAQTTTGVGMGIGIPHAKTAAVDAPLVAFTRSDAGIDFGAMDDEPAHLIFMILVPAEGSDDHLQILSSLSRALMHEEVRESLSDAETKAAVRDTLGETVA